MHNQAVPRGGPIAARIRAAHSYSDLSREKLGEVIGLSPRQLGRLESGEVVPDRDMRERIAVACGVPAMFLEVGFEPLAERSEDVDQRIADLEELTAELAETVRRVVADTAQHRRSIRELSDRRLPVRPVEGNQR